MSLIKTAKEIANDDLKLRVSSLRTKFDSYIKPIFGEDDDKRPFHIGTCTLYSDGINKYLITAAHVLDWNEETPLTIVGDGGSSIYLRGDSFRTKAPDNNRKKDHYDFAWMPLSEDISSRLSQSKFLTRGDIAEPGLPFEGKRFGAIGYPNSKSKDIDNRRLVIQSKSKIYTSSVMENAGLAEFLQVSGNEHLFLNFNSKWSFDEDGHRANSFKPVGMSGGVLIDMGPLFTSLQSELPKLESLKVAGLLIENYETFNSIVAVRFEYILQEIENKK